MTENSYFDPNSLAAAVRIEMRSKTFLELLSRAAYSAAGDVIQLFVSYWLHTMWAFSIFFVREKS